MSYCRWSSDDYMCDLYCYEDVSGGYTTHVARSRWREPPPKTEHLFTKHLSTKDVAASREDSIHEWIEARRLQRKWMDEHNELPVPIGGPHDGESFNDATLEEFRDRLLMLRAAGYRFPDYVLQNVEEEMRR